MRSIKKFNRNCLCEKQNTLLKNPPNNPDSSTHQGKHVETFNGFS